MSSSPRKDRTSHATAARRLQGEGARRAIIASAGAFLSEHSFRDLSISRLMAGTSLSRPAFYQYFSDLHSLIETLLEEIATVMHAAADPWVEGLGEPVAALRESLKGVIGVSLEHGPVFRAITEAAPLDEHLERTWETFMESWNDAVTRRIELQQAAGLVPPLDARALARALNKLDAATLVAEFGKRPQGDPEAVLNTLHRIWVGALYGRC